jgi:hypothetical protein
VKKAGHLLAPLLLGTLALLGSQAPANAAQFCVNTPASLQTALTTAASNGVDDEVRIVQGTYVGNFFYASTEAQALSVLGGYTAGCAGRVLDPVNTILDGNQTNTVLVLSAPDLAAEFLVEELTLRNGKRFAFDGGGLFAQVGNDGTVTVSRNRIEKNTVSGGVLGDYGGGAFIRASTATLTKNSITDNTGGGASINATTAILTDNNITDNMGGCGGVYISALTAALTNNSFTGNTGSGSNFCTGGGASLSGDTINLTNSSFTGNLGSGASLSATTTTLTNNSFMGNTASSGGGVNISATTATLTNNSLMGNTASGFGGFGSGGGARIDASTTTLTNNNITGNTAGYGGGADISASTATLTSNNITGNTASYYGGGAIIYAANPSLTNNTLAGNRASSVGGLSLGNGANEATDTAKLYNNIFWDNVSYDNQHADLLIANDPDGDYLPTPVTLLANNFDQSAAGFQSTLPITLDPSNLDAEDPLFVDQVAGNLRLTAGSPMIDAGYPDTPDLPATDRAGGLRVVNGIVDIGAYEYHAYESCDVGPLVFSAETFDAGGDHHLSEVSIATEGSVEILSEADVVLRAPFLNFGPGFRIETGAQFMALAGPVNCNQ